MMKWPTEIFIAIRYLRAKSQSRFISFISFISIAGIVLGVWAIITVMAVMAGFHNELKDRILYAVSHITIYPPTEQQEATNWNQVVTTVRAHPEVESTAPYIEGPSMISSPKTSTGLMVRGVNPSLEKNVSSILAHIKKGSAESLVPGEYGIVLGKSLANTLQVDVGDKVTLISPQVKATIGGVMPRLRRFTVVSIFEMNLHEYDSGVALIDIQDASNFFSTKGNITGLRLKLKDMGKSRIVSTQLHQQLDRRFYIRDWTQAHYNFFRALETEKRVVFIVLSLIMAVAGFNIVSTLVMLVGEKKSDIAILRTLGMSPKSILTVFVIQGSLIGLIGTAVGATAGVITALNLETIIPALESVFNTELFPADVYMIDKFPAQMYWSDVLLVVSMSLVISFLATLYPAASAAKTHPAEALRHQ